MRSSPSPRCDAVRLALSARLDGEAMPLPAADVEHHLDGCAMCQAWLAGAERVTRAVRVRPAAVPDLTARILAAVRADGSLVGAGRRAVVGAGRFAVAARWGLGLLAVVQLMIAIPELLGVAGHDAHAGREVAALDIAISVGLLVAACYPEYARVFAPVAVTLVVCFASISALDVIQGLVSPTRVAIHVVTLMQAVLVWLLARGSQPRPVAA